ncbi:hypothetical protein JDS82_27565 [Bacillus cereus group sp. N14]|uniref:hypothetical protein n=1 Tax=Bacillus cereus group sp. N14 TaxID=2794587 RepID=UPI0018F6E365|nr:hypothetical protein [Bacillus cereus group sp. N14]
MKRKIGTAVVGLSVLGFGLFGFTHGNGGGIVQAASEGDGGGAPAYAHGNHGGAPTYTHGEGWSPSYAHGHFPAPKLGSDGHIGGAPANTELGGGI